MKSLDELQKIRQAALAKRAEGTARTRRIVVGMATCGITAGARPVMTALVEALKEQDVQDVEVAQTGCKGQCDLEPIVEVYEPDRVTTYVHMDAQRAQTVILEHIVNGRIVEDYLA